MNVKTNVGRTFIKLVDKHFPKGSKLHKIFNNKSLGVSYSCMPNMRSVIRSHKARVSKSKNNRSPKKKCATAE